MSTGKFLAGFVIGGLVGGVIGVLLAPQSGAKTRECIADASKDIYNKAESTVREIQSKADSIVSDVQKKGDEILENIQGLINKNKGENA